MDVSVGLSFFYNRLDFLKGQSPNMPAIFLNNKYVPVPVTAALPVPCTYQHCWGTVFLNQWNPARSNLFLLILSRWCHGCGDAGKIFFITKTLKILSFISSSYHCNFISASSGYSTAVARGSHGGVQVIGPSLILNIYRYTGTASILVDPNPFRM